VISVVVSTTFVVLVETTVTFCLAEDIAKNITAITIMKIIIDAAASSSDIITIQK